MTAREWIGAAQELADAATPGPWSIEDDSCDCGGGMPCGHGNYPCALLGPANVTDWPERMRADYGHRISEVQELTGVDADFIADARTRLPRALDALDAVLKLTYASDDGTEYEHGHSDWGEPECPACWAAGIRGAITDALGVES